MEQSTKRALIIGATAVAGGVSGSWLGTRVGSVLGFRVGPWGVVAGALMGLVAGASLSKGLTEPQALPEYETDEE